MSGGYDEWAAARTPSLLRFAYLLSGDAAVADDLVLRSLERVGAGWSRLVRADDPDRAARSSIVDLCPGRPALVPVPAGGDSPDRAVKVRAAMAGMPVRRRAAVVLRYAEGRSDTEIADVLGCSVTVVRAQLVRAHDSVREHRGQGTPGPVGGVESDLTAALSVVADEAPTSLDRDIPAITEKGRRRRGGVLAALAVMALLGTITVVNHLTSTPAGLITYHRVPVPTTWRVESYDGVEVEVPDTWGWGGAPFHSDLFLPRHLGACGADEAAVQSGADHASYISQATGFVGRPAMMSDLCVVWGADGVFPSGSALWFDSPMPVGLETVSTHTVAETRAVGDQHVTVFSRSSELRRQILGTAHTVVVDANGCPVTGVQRATPVPTKSGTEPTSMSVCVYSQDTGATALEWSGRVGAAAARTYVDAARAGRPADANACGTNLSGQWVTLGVHERPGIRWDVVDVGCGQVFGEGSEVVLDAAVVRPWALPGVRAYVTAGPAVPHDVRGFFRAPAG